MTRGVKVRLLTFVVLAAVGIVYVAASYLGIVDKVLGRGYTVAVTLPQSGGLYVGSEVDYRGVKIGKVTGMDLTKDGARADLLLKPGTNVPRDAEVRIHNLSAVGEQYLDFLPASTAGPYLRNGDTVKAGADALPESTDDLLTKISGFADSVNANDLRTVVSQLGDMFRGNAQNLRTLVDSGSDLVHAATQHEQGTIGLLDNSQQMLATQQAHKDDIAAFAQGLAQVTQALKTSDPQLRDILQGGTSTVQQVQSLVEGLQPVLPVFIANLATVNQVLTARLPAIEQTLVTFPLMVANGFVGTPGDGYGHLNMQLTYTVPACTQGYLPPKDWIPGAVTEDPRPAYPAKCTDPRAQPGYTGDSPINQRGVDLAPAVGVGRTVNGSTYRIGTYDASTGATDLGDGKTVTVTPGNGGGPLSVLDSWEATLAGVPSTGGSGQ